MSRASETVFAMMATQSSDRHAGTRPNVERRPLVGLYPTTPLKPDGTRPEPAVSVAMEKETRLAPTLTQLPDDEPPEM